MTRAVLFVLMFSLAFSFGSFVSPVGAASCVSDGTYVEDNPNTPPYPATQALEDDARCCSGYSYTGGAYYNDHVCAPSGGGPTICWVGLEDTNHTVTVTRNASGYSISSYAYYVDWGDTTNFSQTNTGSPIQASHTWNTPGTYMISATSGFGTAPGGGQTAGLLPTRLTMPDGTYRDSSSQIPAQCLAQIAAAPPSLPDVTAGSITPTSAVAGVATTFTGPVWNQGTASTGANFYSVFQFDNNADHTAIYSSGQNNVATLPGGQTQSSATNVDRSATLSTAGTWYIRICADNNTSMVGTITESDESNNCGPWTTITVAPQQSDLVISQDVTAPPGIVVGTPAVFTAQVQNLGSAATGAGFTNLLQIDNDTDHNTIDATVTDTSPALAVNGTDSTQFSRSFSASGTKYVRVCADNNASMVGTITESNEANNCGAWVQITVSQPATDIYFEAECPASALAGYVYGQTAPKTGFSGNGYLMSINPSSADQATYDFALSTTGTYKIWIRGDGNGTGTDDSIYYSIDGGSSVQVNGGGLESTPWTWTKIYDASLSSGAHTLKIFSREDGFQFDKFYITNSATTPTGTGGSATACAVTNVASNAPVITGPTTGATGALLAFGFTATDPNGNSLRYNIDWDNDGSTLDIPGGEITAYMPSGTTHATSTSWSAPGAYTFKAYSRDNPYAGTNSPWTFFTVAIGNQCQNGIDDDADGYIDMADWQCGTGNDGSENYSTMTAPTNPIVSCSASGTSVTLSWTAGAATDTYFPRISDPSTSSCTGFGWLKTGTTCYKDAITATSVTNFPVTPGQSYTWWVHPGNSAGAANYGTQMNGTAFSCTAPDLIVGSIGPSTATVGQSTTLTVSAITNQGTAPTGAGFYTLFQRATDAYGSGETDIGTFQRSSSLSNGSTITTGQTPYTFSSAGTWYVRACADKTSAAHAGSITESDEGNNCSPWTAITVSNPPPNLTIGTISPTSVTAGVSTQYSTVVTNSGSGTTGGSFNSVFQFDNTSSHSTIDGTASDSSSTLGPSGQDTIQGSFTFTAGTRYVRACADASTSIPGTTNDTSAYDTINETSETDNCTAWATITVTAANNAPNAPVITGPMTGFTGTSYNFTFTATDPDGNQLRYGIDWDNATNPTLTDESSAYVNSGTTYNSSKSWASPGVYVFRARAQDTPGDAYSSWTTHTITISTPLPDVTAGSVTPTSVVQNVATNLSSTITNSGDASTGSSFTNTFFLDDNADHSSVYSTYSASMSSLGQGSNNTSVVSATFPSAGTWYVRTCADNNSSFVGTITESNEGNNCGSWTTITVIPTLSVTCSPSPSTVLTGQTVTWTAYPSGGTGSYTYSWSGTDSLSGSSVSVNKSYSTNGTKTGAVTVTSGTQTLNNVACSSSVLVSTPIPNLTAGSVTPTSATMGSPLTLSANVSNTGTGATGSGFTNLFQQATDSGGANATDIGTNVYGSSLGNGNSFAATLSHTFASAGTWYVRACADKNSGASSGTITESNESDNCGAWTAVAVSEPPPNLTVGIISPTSAEPGVPTAYSVTVTNSGGGTTGVGFASVFQFDNTSSHSTIDGTDTDTSPTLIAAGQDTIQGSFTFAQGTRYVRACADASTSIPGTTNDTSAYDTINETSETDNCTAWATITVTPSPKPDLTVSAVSPTSAVAGVESDFGVTVSNIGNAATGAGFTKRVQIDNDADHNTVYDTHDETMAAFAQGENRSVSIGYTVPTAGTWYARACADWTDVIVESDEGNNCGAWTEITVVAAQCSDGIDNDGDGRIDFGGGASAVTFIDSNADANTSLTLDIGSDTNDRLVVIQITDETTSDLNPTVTVAGQSCSQVIDGVNTSGAGNYQALFYCNETQLGSASGNVSVVITSGCSGSNCGLAAQSFSGVSQSGPADYDMDTTSTDNTANVNIDVPAGGLVILHTSDGASGSWSSWTSPLTEREDYNGISGGAPSAIASGVETSTQTNKQYQATVSSGSRQTGIAASWAPASGGEGSGDAGCTDANDNTENSDPQNPDVTAGSVTPTSAVVDTPLVLSATITNAGNAPTGAGFWNLFQQATDASGSNAADIGAWQRSSSLSNIAPGNTTVAGLSHTFTSMPPVGSYWYVRVCADKDDSEDTGDISESNEGNNCGAWTAISMSLPPQCSDGNDNEPDGNTDYPADPGCSNASDNSENSENLNPPSAVLNAAPTDIIIGSSSLLTWSSTNTVSCSGTNFNTGGATSGSVAVSPANTRLYTLDCIDSFGVHAYSNQTVTVNGPTLNLSASSLIVVPGDSTTITWSVTGSVDSCVVSGPGLSSNTSSGSQAVTVDSTATYTMVCSAGGGAFTPSASITISQTPTYTEE